MATVVLTLVVAEWLRAALATPPSSTPLSSTPTSASSSGYRASVPLREMYVCAFVQVHLHTWIAVVCYAIPWMSCLVCAAYTRYRGRCPSGSGTLSSADTCCLFTVLTFAVIQSPFLIGQRLAADRWSAAATFSPRSSQSPPPAGGLDQPFTTLASLATLLRFTQPLILPALAAGVWFKGRGGVGRGGRLLARLHLKPQCPPAGVTSMTPMTPMTLYADAAGLQLMNFDPGDGALPTSSAATTTTTAATSTTAATTIGSTTIGSTSTFATTTTTTTLVPDRDDASTATSLTNGSTSALDVSPPSNSTMGKKNRRRKLPRDLSPTSNSIPVQNAAHPGTSCQETPAVVMEMSAVATEMPAVAADMSTVAIAKRGVVNKKGKKNRRRKSSGFLSKLRSSISAVSLATDSGEERIARSLTTTISTKIVDDTPTSGVSAPVARDLDCARFPDKANSTAGEVSSATGRTCKPRSERRKKSRSRKSNRQYRVSSSSSSSSSSSDDDDGGGGGDGGDQRELTATAIDQVVNGFISPRKSLETHHSSAKSRVGVTETRLRHGAPRTTPPTTPPTTVHTPTPLHTPTPSRTIFITTPPLAPPTVPPSEPPIPAPRTPRLPPDLIVAVGETSSGHLKTNNNNNHNNNNDKKKKKKKKQVIYALV